MVNGNHRGWAGRVRSGDPAGRRACGPAHEGTARTLLADGTGPCQRRDTSFLLA